MRDFSRYFIGREEDIPMSQYTYSFTSALSDHTIALAPSATLSRISQKHKMATPKFQLCRMKLVRSTRSSIAADRKQAIEYSGYEGSAAIVLRGENEATTRAQRSLILTKTVPG